MGAWILGTLLIATLALSAANVIMTMVWTCLFHRDPPPSAIIVLAFVIVVALLSALL